MFVKNVLYLVLSNIESNAMTLASSLKTNELIEFFQMEFYKSTESIEFVEDYI